MPDGDGRGSLAAGQVKGVERAVFGAVTADDVTAWLDRHVTRRLSARVSQVLFRTGRVSAVYGLRLSDGTSVVAKVYSRPVNSAALAAAVACQSSLAAAGYPCPVPVDGPAVTDTRTVLLESLLHAGQRGDAHRTGIRRGIARSLAWQVGLLRAVPQATRGLTDPPAWARYQEGPWPAPHDRIFDFTVTPSGYEWLDKLAGGAASVLEQAVGPQVAGHSDWYCGNLRFSNDDVVAAYDWDSLITDSEAVIAGLSAGCYTADSIDGPEAPTPEDTRAFLIDYDIARHERFCAAEQATAAAAAAWVMAYNARCQLSATSTDVSGSPLAMLSRRRDEYLPLRW